MFKKPFTALHKVIYFILSSAKEDNSSIGITKLIKLLYLIDVEYYKYFKKIFTEVTDWKFYFYGPYSEALVETISRTPGIAIKDKELLDNGRNFTGFDITAKYNVYKEIEPDVMGVVKGVYDKWADADLVSLLDYVYYETEPMIEAKRDEGLDFSKIGKIFNELPEEINIPEISIPKDRLKKIKELFEERKKRISISVISLPFKESEIYLNALMVMDKEDKLTIPENIKIQVSEDVVTYLKKKEE